MKVLVGAACIAVISLAIYVIGGDYMASRAAERQAFGADCRRFIEDNKGKSAANMSGGEKFRFEKRGNDCVTFLRTGRLPN